MFVGKFNQHPAALDLTHLCVLERSKDRESQFSHHYPAEHTVYVQTQSIDCGRSAMRWHKSSDKVIWQDTDPRLDKNRKTFGKMDP